MKTKQRVLLALLAAAVLLGAALWAVTRSNAKAEQAASAAAEGSIPLSTFAAEDLEQIEYTYNGQTYTLQYSGGSWQLAQDPAYHLDESACNTMRTALMALNAKRSLTPQAGEDYGLDSPQLTVTVTAAGQSTTLIFGAENPVTGDLYVQKAGDDAVYTVSGNKAACFQLDKAGLFGSFCPYAGSLYAGRWHRRHPERRQRADRKRRQHGRRQRLFLCLRDGVAAGL